MNEGEDLRRGGETRTGFTLSIPVSAVIAGLLIITGIMIGLFLPQLSGTEEVEEEPLENGDPVLRIILTSTIPTMEIDGNYLDNVPVYNALEMVYGSDEMEEQRGIIEDFIKEAVFFMVSNSTGYDLEVQPVGGGSSLTINNNSTGTPILSQESTLFFNDDAFIARMVIYGGDLR